MSTGIITGRLVSCLTFSANDSRINLVGREREIEPGEREEREGNLRRKKEREEGTRGVIRLNTGYCVKSDVVPQQVSTIEQYKLTCFSLAPGRIAVHPTGLSPEIRTLHVNQSCKELSFTAGRGR